MAVSLIVETQYSPTDIPFATSDLPSMRRRNFPAGKTKPQLLAQLGFRNLILTMTYSHMGKPHTTIGDASFH
ncbi:hypothetical protein, partial [Pseudomonas sp. PB120]|uniref:hypothetical protein n=1 Tax=Pseudomonas sp. PB120 TaxID=2494700 RepID=UPI001C4983F5